MTNNAQLAMENTLSAFFRQAKVQRGNVKLKQGKLQEAERDFQEAVSLVAQRCENLL